MRYLLYLQATVSLIVVTISILMLYIRGTAEATIWLPVLTGEDLRVGNPSSIIPYQLTDCIPHPPGVLGYWLPQPLSVNAEKTANEAADATQREVIAVLQDQVKELHEALK
jgi:hypothetical protein